MLLFLGRSISIVVIIFRSFWWLGHFLLVSIFFAHFQKSFVHCSNILPSWGSGCPDCSSYCPLSSSGQEKGCFGVGLGVLWVHTYPSEYLTTYNIVTMNNKDNNAKTIFSHCNNDKTKKILHCNNAIDARPRALDAKAGRWMPGCAHWMPMLVLARWMPMLGRARWMPMLGRALWMPMP